MVLQWDPGVLQVYGKDWFIPWPQQPMENGLFQWEETKNSLCLAATVGDEPLSM